MAHQISPNLVANANIRPYRVVAPTGSADNACGESNENNLSMGVVGGDTKAHDSANHAESGDAVSLQPGNVVLIEAGGAITRGGSVMTDDEGRGVAATPTGTANIYHLGIALETAGGAGEIIRMFWQPVVVRPALS